MKHRYEQSRYKSWGRQPQIYQAGAELNKQEFDLSKHQGTLLAYGNGRSYGDSCLNTDGIVLHTKNYDQFIEFDKEKGILKAYSGLLLSDILELIVPHGWFLPVCPGTKYISLGGAIANDIHGKNHHSAGTFGAHVIEFEILRSDGQRLVCSKTQNTELFQATIGGLGLTGLITWISIKLKAIGSQYLDLELIKFQGLHEFLKLSDNSDKNYEYTVSWFDCMVSKEEDCKGIFMRANHSNKPGELSVQASKELCIPFIPPFSFVNNLSMKLFNWLYYYKQIEQTTKTLIHYNPFFYPLDSVNDWNRLYGANGFVQFQFVIARENSLAIINHCLQTIQKHNTGSSLSVLKVFGDIVSPGMLSFPRPGLTLAMDFPYQQNKTEKFLDEISAIITEAGGAIYPAKDMHMSGIDFKQAYPRHKEFMQHIDPKFNSNFWSRVNG